MAVGVVFAGMHTGETGLTLAAAFALAIGMAVQNIPEGAIISMPLYASGKGKLRSFILGALSGAVEPIGAVLTILAAGIAVPILPYLLGFAAGAMMYAVLEEFTEKGEGDMTPVWILSFSAGFLLMMSLDVLLS
jgi:ZIP family zinc transporter